MLSNRLFKASAQRAGYLQVSPAASNLTQTVRPFFSSFVASDATTPTPTPGDDTKEKVETIRRKDIVDIIVEEHDVTKTKAERILTTVLDTIIESVREKKDVKISDFGSFQSVHAKARSGTNPSTGASIVIPAKERIRFKPFAAFKSVINK